MSKKYELTDETNVLEDYVTVRRIRALKDFADVKKGDLGGWIELDHNLSHDGDCWVYDDAVVIEDAEVYGNARIFDGARICGDALVYDNTRVYGNARVYEDAEVSGNAEIYGNARVYGNAEIYGNARVYGNAEVYGYAVVSGNAKVYEIAEVSDYVRILKDASIATNRDYFRVGPIGSRDDYTTFYRSENGIMVACGCFNDTIEKFEQQVRATHKNNRYAKQYSHVITCIKNIFTI